MVYTSIVYKNPSFEKPYMSTNMESRFIAGLEFSYVHVTYFKIIPACSYLNIVSNSCTNFKNQVKPKYK